MDCIISRLSLSLIIIIIVISVKFSFAAINGEDQRPLLHDLLEKALTGNSSNLFELQKVYFHPAGKRPGIISLSARVIVGNISNTTYIGDCPAFSCNDESSQCHSNNSFYFTLSPYNKDNSTLQIPNLLGPEGYDVLRILDPGFCFLTGALAIPQWLKIVFSKKSDSKSSNSEIALEFYISELNSMPEYGELCDALSMLLVWAKTYARPNESEKQNCYNDRSIISINDTATDTSDHLWYCQTECELPNQYYSEGYRYETLSTDVALNLVLGIVLLTNVLLFILSLRYFHHAYYWLFKKEWLKKSFYRSSVIVLLLINCFTCFYAIIVSYYNNKIFSFRNGVYVKVRVGLLFSILATLVMPGLEFLCIFSKLNMVYYRKLGMCKAFLHSIGFFQMIWFAHRLLIDAIISVILFIIAPAQTIGIVTLILFTILSVIIFLAQLFNNKCHCDLTCFCIVITGIISVVLVIMITLLFITLVDNGLQSAGMGGFILSIIPPIIALIIGVYINRQTLDGFHKWFRSESDSTHNQITVIDNEQVDAIAVSDGNINEGTHLLVHT